MPPGRESAHARLPETAPGEGLTKGELKQFRWDIAGFRLVSGEMPVSLHAATGAHDLRGLVPAEGG